MVCTCVYWLLQNNEFNQIGMHLIYFINLKNFQNHKWCKCCYLFIYFDCNVLHSEIDILDLNMTTVHAGCSKLLPLKNHIASCLLFSKQKRDVHGRAYTIALPLYTSDIEITLIVLIRITIARAKIITNIMPTHVKTTIKYSWHQLFRFWLGQLL